MNRFAFLIPLLAFGFATMFGQKVGFPTNYYGGPVYNDAQLWQNIYVEKPLTQKWLWHINEEGKLTENMTLPSYIYTDLGLSYKFRRYLHISFSYVPIANVLPTNFIEWEHQIYIDYVLKLKCGNFILYDREMFQEQYNNVYVSKEWNVPYNYLRTKFTVKYKLGLRLIPYVATEFYYHCNNDFYPHYEGKQFDHIRYFAGCFYKLDKTNELEVYYLIENYFNIPAAYTDFVIGIGYAHDLY